jgi:hypothetical protein
MDPDDVKGIGGVGSIIKTLDDVFKNTAVYWFYSGHK